MGSEEQTSGSSRHAQPPMSPLPGPTPPDMAIPSTPDPLLGPPPQAPGLPTAKDGDGKTPTTPAPSGSGPQGRGRGAKRAILIVAGLVGVLFLGILGLVIAVVVTGDDAPSPYCQLVDDYLAAAQSGDLDQLRIIANAGAVESPPEIVESWNRLATALGDLGTQQTQADEATQEILDHDTSNCS